MFEANVSITNNTEYHLTIWGDGPHKFVIEPFSNVQWVSSETSNIKDIHFSQEPNVFFVSGEIIFGQNDGVYLNRGYMPEDNQFIEMITNVNGKEWTQNSNGGNLILQPNEFQNGGNISLIFNQR